MHHHLHEEHDPEALLAEAKRAADMAPESAEAQLALAKAYREAANWDEALNVYRRAAELDPASSETRDGQAAMLMNLDRFDEAASAFREGLALDPNSAQAHDGLGRALSRLGQDAEAEAAFRRAIELDPQSAAAHQHLGESLASQGRAPAAEAEFKAAAETADDAEVLSGIAAGYHLLHKYSLAIKYYRRALNFSDSGYTHGGLAGAYRRSGEHKRALKHLQEAYARISPDDGFARACLAAIAGRPDEAFEHLQAHLRDHPADRYFLKTTAVLEFIKEDPRWAEVIGK